MKEAIHFLGCLLISLFSYTLQAQNQPLATCAESRIDMLQRKAVAAPVQMHRMNQYDVTFYKLDLQLERNSTFIAGNVTTVAQLKVSRLDTFAFELHPDLRIDSVLVNGRRQTDISRQAGDVSVQLAAALQAPASLSAQVFYQGTAPSASGSAAIGNGLRTAREANWGGANVTWSLSQPYAAYEWWPTKQVLTDKADSVHVFVSTSADNKVGSNGLLTRTVPLPNNKVRYEWKSRYPIAYYLISVAVSDYIEYNLSANPAGAAAPIPIVNYVYNTTTLSRFQSEIDVTVPLLEAFSEMFTLYPFAAEKYGHSMAPMGGGMEHQTMTTQSTFNFNLTAHELGHQWFGDNVTCASWADIWLNEGFASYAEYLALEKLRPLSAPDWIRTAQGRVLAVPSGSVFVEDTTDVNRIFDYRLSYLKGATVLHMLRFTLHNDALFFQALQRYQQKYAGETASTADLQRVFEETTGMDLDYFFGQWYKGEGWPTITLQWEQQGNQVVLNATQTPSASTPFFKTDVEYLLQTAAGDTLIRVPHTQPAEQYTFQLDRQVTGVTIDPNNWLLARKVISNVTSTPIQPSGLQARVYPNPTRDILLLEDLSFQPTVLDVHDRTGRLVLRQRVRQGQLPQVRVAALPAGLYLVKAFDGSRFFQAKFVKE
ncbi:M1 family aminopeptidase [Pontibacter roseus]|uniref:M1 family aminopeptidase n=1 Tax=Pontibacter roseus TaxID=336989 RepID=UPI0003A43A1B|nr:M1 family aminopeptidase [Pontibacter roseus]